MAKIKVHSLTGRITSDLMRRAFRNVKRNRGVAGIDKVSITMFEANLEQNLLALMHDLKTGTSTPPCPCGACISLRVRARPVRWGSRPSATALLRRCSGSSCARSSIGCFTTTPTGFRPGRNCHMAVEKVLEFHRLGYTHVLDADIQGFFDNLPHDVIMTGVAAEVADGNILDLIEKFLKAGVMEDGVFQPTRKGTPQGGVISPLLANIALNSLDWHLHHAGYRFVPLCRRLCGALPDGGSGSQRYRLWCNNI